MINHEILEYGVIGLISLNSLIFIRGLFKKDSTLKDSVQIGDGTQKKASKPTVKDLTKPVEVEKPVVEEVSWNKRLFKGLARTRTEVWSKVGSLLGADKMDSDVLDELEEVLFTSDLSPVLVDELIEELKKLSSEGSTQDYLPHIKQFLNSKMSEAQSKVNKDLYTFEKSSDLKVIMIVGVNGAGKTTTIGKFATKLKKQGAKVVVGACDTFRAAAVEQLEVWCNRAGVEIVKAGEGADPSGVAFDAVKKAKEIGADYCIIDTAGRLHTKSNLMDELAKTKRVMRQGG